MQSRLILIPLLLSAALASAAALAQDRGSVNPEPLPPLANPNDPKIGAKELFGRKVLPAAMPSIASATANRAERVNPPRRNASSGCSGNSTAMGRAPTTNRS